MSGQIIDDGAISPGEYKLKYLDYRTLMAWKVPRVVVRFSVLDYGEYFERELDRWYRVMQLTGKAGKRGNFKVGRRSHLFREYANLFGAPGRNDRISFVGLKDKIVVGRVRTVTQGMQGDKAIELSEASQYSVVDELLRIE